MTTETLPVLRPAPAEPTTPTRPSEAIRLGCLIAPVQGFGMAAFDRDKGRACVIQAMLMGGRSFVPPRDIECPVGGEPRCARRPADCTLVHLNDDHRWSRERIADWLEGLGL